jgi:Tfp pilus assembly protein PilE
MISLPALTARRLSGFALMEVLVVVAIVLTLTVIAVPVVNVFQSRNHKAAALKVMKDLGSATLNYCAQHENQLPGEDVPGPTTWNATSDPKNEAIWFNVLPKQMGRKGVRDFANNPAAFYTKDNLLYVEGAPYPTNDTRLVRPLFAIAFNRKLERKTENNEKIVRLTDITTPARTVLFLSQGLPKEKKSVDQQPHYDGQPKGSARTFVGRYGGKGILTYCDGHTEEVEPSETLDVTGQILTPQTNFIWTTKPEADPNHL